MDFLALIDCLVAKLLKNYGVQFFRAIDPIIGALNEDRALLVLFSVLQTLTKLFYLLKHYFCIEFYSSDLVLRFHNV